MKKLNILSLVQAYNSLDADTFLKYIDYFKIQVKNEEINDLDVLLKVLSTVPQVNLKCLNGFYIGYRIPQIGKEFDLLRFGENFVINIEIKKTCSEDKILKQLTRNKYYLSFLQKTVHHMTFVADTKQFYYLNLNEQLLQINSEVLVGLLNAQVGYDLDVDVDSLFNPSDYLVSPFNATQRFLEDRYFLTHQQESIKENVLNKLNIKNKSRYISITGGAGTGKTLLVYDIVKNMIKSGQKVLIIHVGNLNVGHFTLKSKGWYVFPVKSYRSLSFKRFDLIVVDEAQRLKPSQLDYFISEIESVNGACIFSYDRNQTLSDWETRYDFDSVIKGVNGIDVYSLTDKIRTNKEISTFIGMLFNCNRSFGFCDKGNIEISYFNNSVDASNYLKLLDSKSWEVIRFTPSTYNSEYHSSYSDRSKINSHNVIGQEYDNVAITIDEFFGYDVNGDLIYNGSTYYSAVKMLFQNITRARKKLNVVIINNKSILLRCLSIMSK
ncbi:DNA/RNA helicase domain-containing protein [Shewanella xiamenensis]|uniref:DNA/RNA helicase domain-containing protein n=1 Tax=Shewanella xiamenensis TaxID=332186 RepID=UPI0035BAE31E